MRIAETKLKKQSQFAWRANRRNIIIERSLWQYSAFGAAKKQSQIFRAAYCVMRIASTEVEKTNVLRQRKLKKQSQFYRAAYCVMRIAPTEVEKTKPNFSC